MIYFFDNDLQLQKVVVSANLLLAQHEHELNNLIRADVAVDLSYAKSFIDDVDHFGYYYKDVFYLHKIQSVEDDHANELLIISGRHIFFDDMLFGPLIRDVRPQNQEAGFMLRQTIEANTRWNIVMTDVTGRLSTNFYWVPPYEALEWITENFRLEYLPVILFDGQNINGYQLHVKKRIGEQKHIRIPWGERVEQLTHEIDYSEIITKLSVRGKGEEVGDGYGRRIHIGGTSFSRDGVVSPQGNRYLENPAVTNRYGNDGQTPREGDVTFEDIEVVSELVEAGYQHYLDVSRPQVLISADVAQIGDVAIGDGVLIIRREHEMYFEARVHKLSVDLLNQEDAQIELGDYDHFKETKVERRTRQNNERVERELSSRIQQLKLDFDYRFDGEVAQMREDFEQALIDAHAEIQAAEQRMETLIESERDTMMNEFNENVQEARNYAEQQAQEHSDRVQSNLESFEQTHQQLYDSVTSDIMDIDTFLGDKSMTLAQQFAEVESDFSGLQTELNGVSEDLGNAKTDLQQQIDDADSSIDTANNMISVVEGRITDAEGKLVTNDQNIADARKRLTQAEQDISEHGTDIGTVQQTLSNIDGELASKVERTEYDALEGTVTSHGTRISQNETDISSKADQSEVDTISGTVSDHSTEISQNAKDIKSKADSTTVDSIDETVTSHSTLISQNATDIQSKADASVVDSLAGTVENHSTEISQNAQRIESKAEQSIVDTMSGTVSDHESRITQNAKGIESKVSSEELRAEIDAVEVGGRNLLAESLMTDNYALTTSNGTFTTVPESVSNAVLSHKIPVGSKKNIIVSRKMGTSTSRFPDGVTDHFRISFYTEEDEHIDGSSYHSSGQHFPITRPIPEDADYVWMSSSRQDLRNLKAEFGTIATDWTPAPEDVQSEITQLNTILTTHDTTITQNAEAITSKADRSVVDALSGTVGEHSTTIMQTAEELQRKAESSVVVAINETVESNSLSITETAKDVTSLIEKTELHDGDIAQWSNETQSNAESISQTITRVEETESGIRQAQSNIQTNADGIAGVIRDVETIDGELSTLTTDFNVEAGKIETLISKTDGHGTQLTNIVADINGIETIVAANDEWLGTYGSAAEQTIEGFEQKVWLSDVANINPNLIPFTDVSAPENKPYWNNWGTNVTTNTWVDNLGYMNVDSSETSTTIRIQSEEFDLVEGQEYTLSFLGRTSSNWNTDGTFAYTFILWPNQSANQILPSSNHTIRNLGGRLSGLRSYTHTFTARHTDKAKIMLGTYRFRNDEYARFTFKEPKLEKGSERTPFLNAFSNIEQTANSIRLSVLGELDGGYVTKSEFDVTVEGIESRVAKIDGGGVLKQSDISVTSDSVIIGSQEISNTKLASIIAVSPSAIDMITDELNLTGNLNVKGQIESISMDAIEGNFARLWAAEFKAIAIDVNDIHGVTAHFEYLYTLNANIEKLVSQTAFINEINTLSLNAVYGNISDLRTELLTANVITSNHIKVESALIDKMFASTALIERLTSKSAFIRDIQAIEITANQLNLTTLTNRINQIEGGLRITRPDGVDWVRNGRARGHVPVQVSDGYAGANVRFNGTNYITGSSSYQTMKYFYTPHEGTRLRVVFAVGLFGGPSSVEFMHVRVRGFSGYNPINMGLGSSSQRVRVISGETNYVTLDIPMAPPNYSEMAAYLEFRRDPDGQHSDNEVYARLLHIGQYE